MGILWHDWEARLEEESGNEASAAFLGSRFLGRRSSALQGASLSRHDMESSRVV